MSVRRLYLLVPFALAARENSKKERETISGRYTDVFVKDGGRWIFIAWAGGEDPKK